MYSLFSLGHLPIFVGQVLKGYSIIIIFFQSITDRGDKIKNYIKFEAMKQLTYLQFLMILIENFNSFYKAFLIMLHNGRIKQILNETNKIIIQWVNVKCFIRRS